MVFIETPRFSKWRDAFLSDDLFLGLLGTLQNRPEGGTTISGGHGLRKIRVALPGRGKRGGARVIYFYWAGRDQVYFLYGYAKNAQADLTKGELAYLVDLMREEMGNGQEGI